MQAKRTTLKLVNLARLLFCQGEPEEIGLSRIPNEKPDPWEIVPNI
jgi:hypothetical protein